MDFAREMDSQELKFCNFDQGMEPASLGTCAIRRPQLCTHAHAPRWKSRGHSEVKRQEGICKTYLPGHRDLVNPMCSSKMQEDALLA